jgi:hypothetical protein
LYLEDVSCSKLTEYVTGHFDYDFNGPFDAQFQVTAVINATDQMIYASIDQNVSFPADDSLYLDIYNNYGSYKR